MQIRNLFISIVIITLFAFLGCSREGLTDVGHWSSGIPGNTAEVTITANVSNFDVVFEYKFDNDNFNLNYSIEKRATGSQVILSKVPYGTYKVTVSKSGYDPYTLDNFTVKSATVTQSVALSFYNVGDTGPAGGKIFYDKGSVTNGWRYLEAAPASTEFNAEWGGYGTNVTGTSTAIGTGKSNTDIIVARLAQLGETGRAAQLCVAMNVGGKSDWFLPSRDELNLMYVNLHLQGLGGFGQGTNSSSWMNWYYWSSSQSIDDTNYAWNQYFGNGGHYFNYFKYNTSRVRAIRAF